MGPFQEEFFSSDDEPIELLKLNTPSFGVKRSKHVSLDKLILRMPYVL